MYNEFGGPSSAKQGKEPLVSDIPTELLGLLAKQLGLDPELESVASAESGSLVWDFYSSEYQSCRADLALAEDGEKAYFVLLISAPDEHDALYNQLFLPAVEALAPLAAEEAKAEDEGAGEKEGDL